MKVKLGIIACLLVIASILLVAPVMADSSTTTPVSGNPTPTIDLSFTGSVAYQNFVPGNPHTNSFGGVSLVVQANNASWSVDAKDAGTLGKTHTGYLVEFDGTNFVTTAPKYMQQPLKIKAGSGTAFTAGGSFQPLTGQTSGLIVGTGVPADAGTTSAITFTQDVYYSDPIIPTAGHYYNVVTEFDGGIT
jgi:hypothetical protein